MTERTITTTAKGRDKDAPRSGRTRAVADIVPDVGRAAFRRFGFVQSSIVSRWAEIVGQRFAAVATPESIRFPAGRKSDGVLNLVVEGAHAAVLQHVAPAIIERVNRFFGYAAVARIAIRQGAARPVEPRRAPPSLRPMSIELGESLRAIVDPELRACLAALGQAVEASAGPPLVGIPIRGVIGR